MKKCRTPVLIVIILLIIAGLAIMCYALRGLGRREQFTDPVVADLIYVYRDGPDSKQFTPTWAKFTDDYRENLGLAGVHAHKFKDTDPEVKQYALKAYPVILLSAPDHGALQTVFTGKRSVQTIADFVHTNYPTFDPKKFRKS